MTALPPIHRWDSVARPRAAIQILHGMAEHGARYARLAAALNDSGFIVWAHDHRGHGLNPTPPVGLGHFADAHGWRALVDDATAVSQRMRETYGGLPLVLFAHSMGSFVGQALMGEQGAMYQAVVLSGTNGSNPAPDALGRVVARVQRLVRGGRNPGTWLHRIVLGGYNRRFAPNRTTCDWLSRDPQEVDKYVNDPLCGFALTAQSWLDFLVGKSRLADDSHLQKIPKTLPVYVISGARDPVGEDLRGVERLLSAYQRVGLTNVSRNFYDGARHELVNETNRDEVTRDLQKWLDIAIGR